MQYFKQILIKCLMPEKLNQMYWKQSDTSQTAFQLRLGMYRISNIRHKIHLRITPKILHVPQLHDAMVQQYLRFGGSLQWRADGLGCPGQRGSFLVISQNFSNSSPKISYDLFSFSFLVLQPYLRIVPIFRTFSQFHENSVLACPQCCIMPH